MLSLQSKEFFRNVDHLVALLEESCETVDNDYINLAIIMTQDDCGMGEDELLTVRNEILEELALRGEEAPGETLTDLFFPALTIMALEEVAA